MALDNLEVFKSTKPSTKQLKKQYPEISDLLTGRFSTEVNDYRQFGLPILSRDLLQGRLKNPTHGIIDVCDNKSLKTSEDLTEIVTILEEALQAEVNGEERVYKKGDKLIAPPNSQLKFSVKDNPVIYFCQYTLDHHDKFVKILREQFGWTVEGSSYSRIPEPKSKFRQIAKESVEYIKKFLLGDYLIVDEFGIDHVSRSDFRRKMEKEQPEISSWVYNHGKLGGNKLFNVTKHLNDIKNATRDIDPYVYRTLNRLFAPEIYSPHGRTYHRWSLKKKIEYVKQVDQTAYKFLEALSK